MPHKSLSGGRGKGAPGRELTSTAEESLMVTVAFRPPADRR